MFLSRAWINSHVSLTSHICLDVGEVPAFPVCEIIKNTNVVNAVCIAYAMHRAKDVQ